DFSVRLGQALGLTQETVATWNVLKWPLILLVLTFLVSQAFYRGPNILRPRYRIVTTGATFAVIILFSALVFTGWLLERVTMFEQLFTTVNGILYVILMIWIAFIVMLAAAAWDAEMLRARQLASGYSAGQELQLATEHTWVLRGLEAATPDSRRTTAIDVVPCHNSGPVAMANTLLLAGSNPIWATTE